MNSHSGRARPLAPDERRAAILDAVIPLLIEKGSIATTAEMAAAAGIAEGTIFRVFPDKASLLHAAIAKTLDPAPVKEALGEIPADRSLAEQLTMAAEILATSYESVTALVAIVRSIPHEEKPHPKAHRIATEAMAEVAKSLTALMERHSDMLTVQPRQAAILLRGLVFTNAHDLLAADGRMTPEQLVSAIGNGIFTAEAR